MTRKKKPAAEDAANLWQQRLPLEVAAEVVPDEAPAETELAIGVDALAPLQAAAEPAAVAAAEATAEPLPEEEAVPAMAAAADLPPEPEVAIAPEPPAEAVVPPEPAAPVEAPPARPPRKLAIRPRSVSAPESMPAGEPKPPVETESTKTAPGLPVRRTAVAKTRPAAAAAPAEEMSPAAPRPTRRLAPLPTSDRPPTETAIKLGKRLRDAREEMQLAVSDVAKTTHIRTDYIQLLENGQVGDMGVAPIFVKSYVKSLCRTYHLDTQEMVGLVSGELDEGPDLTTRSPKSADRGRVYAAVEEEGEVVARADVLRRYVWPLISVALLVLVGGLIWAISHRLRAGQPAADPGLAAERIVPPEQIEQLIVPVEIYEPSVLHLPERQ